MSMPTTMSTSTTMSMSPETVTTTLDTPQTQQSETDTSVLMNRTASAIKDIGFKAFIFILVFGLFTCNMLAVSMSLQCNRNKDFRFKITSAIFAFMFGFLYIFVNYISYRVNMKNNPCMLHANNPFPF